MCTTYGPSRLTLPICYFSSSLLLRTRSLPHILKPRDQGAPTHPPYTAKCHHHALGRPTSLDKSRHPAQWGNSCFTAPISRPAKQNMFTYESIVWGGVCLGSSSINKTCPAPQPRKTGGHAVCALGATCAFDFRFGLRCVPGDQHGEQVFAFLHLLQWGLVSSVDDRAKPEV